MNHAASSRPISRSERWWNRKAHGYANRPIEDLAAYKEKLARTQALFTPTSQVLEYGCGTGSTALVHAPHVGRLLAVDSSATMIEIAEEKALAGGHGNLSFRCAALAEIAAEGLTYDIVLGLNVLHLLDDWRAGIRHSYDLVKPGGYFVSSTACIAQLGPFLRFLLPIGGMLGVIPKVAQFDRNELVAALKDAGFHIHSNEVLNSNGTNAFIICNKPN